MKTRTRLEILGTLLFAACAAFLLFAMSLFVGCKLPGQPGSEPEVPRPEEVKNFDTLYGANCAGCHGANGTLGPSSNLANPVYLAFVDDATLKDEIANGEKGTLMPSFHVKHGGTLTDEQIDVLVAGMRSRWGKANALAGATPPPYKATHAGNAANGQQVYAATCASCHGESAQKPGKAGSILDGSLLALLSEQTIRTTVIAGRPDLGMPDWRSLRKDRALTDEEITDVTAWLLSQKPALPGQPYGSAAPPTTTPAAATTAARPEGKE